jgi:hypothetical protein
MVKVNDRVYHVHNMGLKGMVEQIQVEASQMWMVSGPTHGRTYAYVRLADGKVVKLPVEDLMRDD